VFPLDISKNYTFLNVNSLFTASLINSIHKLNFQSKCHVGNTLIWEASMTSSVCRGRTWLTSLWPPLQLPLAAAEAWWALGCWSTSPCSRSPSRQPVPCSIYTKWAILCFPVCCIRGKCRVESLAGIFSPCLIFQYFLNPCLASFVLWNFLYFLVTEKTSSNPVFKKVVLFKKLCFHDESSLEVSF